MDDGHPKPFDHIFRLRRSFTNGIFRNLRLVGTWAVPDGSVCNGCGLFEMDGDGDDVVSRVALVNMTMKADPDGAPQMWCGVKDVTVDRVLIMDSNHPLGVSCPPRDGYPYPPGDIDARERITIFRTILARNGERQPQLRRGVYKYDFESSIIADWLSHDGSGQSGYGMRFRDEKLDDINVTNSAFLDSGYRPGWSCFLGTKPGPDKGSGGEGDEEPIIRTRSIFFDEATNIGGDQCRGKWALSAPNPRPYVLPIIPLSFVPTSVGAFPRTPDEQALLDQIATRLP